jgi:hypothetical protein
MKAVKAYTQYYDQAGMKIFYKTYPIQGPGWYQSFQKVPNTMTMLV